MNTFTRFTMLCLMSGSAAGQTSLPACKGSVVSSWTNCFDSAVFKNGDEYIGEFKAGKAHGRGTYTSVNGDKYVGDFKANEYNGHGTYTFSDGEKYVGEFRSGLKNGRGTYTYKNGDVYVGEHRQGKANGRGTFTFINGEKYVGSFKDDLKHGYGNYTFVNGDTYVGEVADDFYNGSGTFTFANGGNYIGHFKNSMFDGIGTLKSASGENYTGGFKNNMYEGRGKVTLASGDTYVGEFRNSLYEGNGTYTLANGDRFFGEFREGMRNGNGTFIFANGDKFVGQYKDNLAHGQGIEYKSDGTVFTSGTYIRGIRDSRHLVSSNEYPFNPTLASDSSQPISTGSGFRITKNTFITNHHVVDGCSRIKVNGQTAQLRQSDKRADLAQLRANVDGPAARLRGQRAGIGEPVAVTGFPLRGLLSGFNMTTGTISSLSGLGGSTQYFQITAPVQQGNSGGPMLDSAGNVVGVVVSKLDVLKVAEATGDIPQNVNFAINTNSLRSFLDAGQLDYAVAGNDPPLPLTTIAERARGFTVLVECWK